MTLVIPIMQKNISTEKMFNHRFMQTLKEPLTWHGRFASKHWNLFLESTLFIFSNEHWTL